MADSPSSVNERTTVPLTWVAVIVMGLLATVSTVLGAYAWLDNRFDSVERRLIVIEHGVGDRWRRTDMRTWTESLRNANPTLKVPDVLRKGN